MDSVNVENISFTYPLKKIKNSRRSFCLSNVSFSLSQGVFLSVLGPNGSGKSTLLKLLTRSLQPDAGKIKVFGCDLFKITQKELSRKIAYVPQIHPMVFPFNVYEMVLMGRSPFLSGIGFEGLPDKAIVEEALQKVDMLSLSNMAFDKLSGGEKQRVFLARALAQQCPLLILDEPNTHLDLSHQLQMLTLISDLVKEKTISVVAVFHDLNLASMFSDKILLLKSGNISAYGDVREVLCEKIIEDVFDTEVKVDEHPTQQLPRITLLPVKNITNLDKIRWRKI
jgi:iron complex transport system ATP-binding protein